MFNPGYRFVACCVTSAALVLVTGVPMAVAQSAAPAYGSPTAAEVIDRIVKATGAALPAGTVDTIKAGDPGTVTTGIAATFTPTMDVLRKAVTAHLNLIVTHEPTFYNHLDQDTLFVDDPVYTEKLEYIREHHLVIWRFHDSWHLRHPDGIVEGFVAQAGWKPYQSSSDETYFTLPQTTVLVLSKNLQRRFHARAVRIIGDPNMKVTKIAFRPGAGGEARQVKALERDDVEVLVAGEAAEWETVLYTLDAAQQGRRKALILLGHDTSEEAGMENCASWLKTVLPGIPVRFIAAGEPYWTTEELPMSAKR